MAVREEMWAQAARDRDALEAELGLRHEEERSRFLEEANERASEIIEEVRVARCEPSPTVPPPPKVVLPARRPSWMVVSTTQNTTRVFVGR